MPRFAALGVMSAVLETSPLFCRRRGRRQGAAPAQAADGASKASSTAPGIAAAPKAAADPPPHTAFDLDRRALAVLDELLDAHADERARWFAGVGESDPVLANQVAILLRAEAAGSALLPTEVPTPAPSSDVRAPERIGPYRLVTRLGQGGMGEVFLGLRDDGLFEQSVAVKIVKTGRLTPELASRFAEERRILAKLQHPHIAQLFDGGIDASTRSFIVMEYLDGESLTDHVQHGRIGLHGVLGLFLDVCSAVQFAHQNFVVHADIKPSNILVTAKSGVKLLDFGIAQLIDPSAGASSLERGHEPMTRAYAAPERLLGAPPSVAGDVYSLGALLFELLVGSLPEALTAPAGLSGTARQASRALRARGGPAAVKAAELQGDLDAIIAKALAHDAGDRYSSVMALADDVDRYRQRLPVRARADTWQYRTSKFISRHRVGLAVTVLFIAALGAAAAGMTRLYLGSEQARARAVQRFSETRSMANYMIFDVDPQLARLPGSLSLRRAIVSNAHAYLKSLEADPSAPPALKLEIANGYLRLARIDGLDVSGGVGDLSAARASLRQAKAIIASVPAGGDVDTALRLAEADADVIAANESFVSPDPRTMPATLQILREASEEYRAVLLRRPAEIDAALGLWRAEVMCGRIFQYLDRSGEATALVERSLGLARPKPVSESQVFESNYLRTASYLILAENYQDRGDGKKAFHYFDALNTAVLGLDKATHESVDNDYLRSSALSGMATVLLAQGETTRPVDLYRQSISLMRRILTFGPNDAVSLSLSQVTVRLANALSRDKRDSEASTLMDRAVAEIRQRTAQDPANGGLQRILALDLGAAATLEHRRGRQAAGCRLDRQDQDQWALAQRSSGAMPMDLLPGGPLEALKNRLKSCNAS